MEKFREFYSANCLKGEGFVIGNHKEGLWVYYYENGSKFREIDYNSGIENGVWKMWHENGNLYIEDHKRNGRSNGLWKEYYENGKIKEIGEHLNQEYIPKDFWDKEGNQLLINGSGHKIEEFGAEVPDLYIHYFENGKFIKEVRI